MHISTAPITCPVRKRPKVVKYLLMAIVDIKLSQEGICVTHGVEATPSCGIVIDQISSSSRDVI